MSFWQVLVDLIAVCAGASGSKRRGTAGMKRPAMVKKKPAMRIKRPASRKELEYTLSKAETHDGAAWDRQRFVSEVRKWATATRENPTSINIYSNDWNRSCFYYKFHCASCGACEWQGFATYNPSSREVVIKAVALLYHSNKPKQWGGSKGFAGLTQVAKDIVRNFVLAHKGAVRIQQVMQAWGFKSCKAYASVSLYLYASSRHTRGFRLLQIEAWR